MLLDLPAVIVGRGPAPVTVAKLLAGEGVPCLLAGHAPLGGPEPVVLDDAAVAVLERHHLLGVLLPFVAPGRKPSIAAGVYEEVVKHHCVADVNVTVYDAVALIDPRPRPGGTEAALTDGRSRWDVRCRWLVDGDTMPVPLSDAIAAAETVVHEVLADLSRH